MAEYQARTGYDPSTGTGTDPADTIESQWIRKLERDLWARFWGPGVACANYDSNSEYERCTGWNQIVDDAPSMGVVSGNTIDHHTTHGTCSVGGHTNQDDCVAAGGTWTGVTSNHPADVDPANPVDRDPVAPGREPNTVADMTNHPLTSTVALNQHLAIIRRINNSITRTGYSTGGVGGNVSLLPEVTRWGALRGSSATLETGLVDDLSRIRDDHINNMSAEIEFIGLPLNSSSSSLGTYNFNKIHTVGIHGDNNTGVYNDTINGVNELESWSYAWGNDYWAQEVTSPWPWSASGGTDTGIERIFQEARYRFANWEDFRYFFNQGGAVRIDPEYISNMSNPAIPTNDGSWGGNNWQNLCEGEVYIGQHTSYTENLGNATTLVQGGYALSDSVTADAPRAHAIADQPNHYISGTGTAGTTNGTTITGLTTTNMAAGDILHIGSWFGEIETVSSGQVELRQILRNLGGTAQTGTISNQDWSCSKWYRACHYDGASGLYGPSTGLSPGNSQGGDGYILFDWRLDFLDGPMDLFVRCMYANTMHISIHGTGSMYFGKREPTDATYFKANHVIESITKDKASTSESYNSRART